MEGCVNDHYHVSRPVYDWQEAALVDFVDWHPETVSEQDWIDSIWWTVEWVVFGWGRWPLRNCAGRAGFFCNVGRSDFALILREQHEAQDQDCGRNQQAADYVS
jgi:hypothetical protein